MTFPITIEDLATNALIERIERKKKYTVCFSELLKYAEAIRDKLREKGNSIDFIVSRDRIREFAENSNGFFHFTEFDNDVKITLKEGVSTATLRNRFRIRLPITLLEAFVSEEALKTII